MKPYQIKTELTQIANVLLSVEDLLDTNTKSDQLLEQCRQATVSCQQRHLALAPFKADATARADAAANELDDFRYVSSLLYSAGNLIK